MKLKYTLLFLLISTFIFAANPHKTTSVLATGNWYKIAVQKTGIYKIAYQDLIDMGFPASQLFSAKLKVFGNGSGMLPESNAGYRYDDLRENSIEIVDGGDGKIDAGDYVLFYGESPDKWTYNRITGIYSHAKNLYADFSYYFITFSDGTGDRVTFEASSGAAVNNYSVRFDDYAFHELDSLNLIRSGRIWYGEVFNNSKDVYVFHFSFPNINTGFPVRVVTSVAARAGVVSKFLISSSGKSIDSLMVESTDLQSVALYGRPKQKASSVANPSPEIDLTMKYVLPDANSLGWLDYLELNCNRNLKWAGPQMSFRDASSVGPTYTTEFVMSGADPSVVVWDVTDPGNIHHLGGELEDNAFKFRLQTDTLREFISFDGSMFYPVTLVGPVSNQNLHATEPHDMVIVTNPVFIDQADSLAEFHRANHLSVVVATTTEIYNEFASGKPDLTAIRDFMKMLYDRGTDENKPQYLLLFGDGSYDPKDRVPNNNNMVPTYQSLESLKYIGTYVTDDYFGIMGDNEGEGTNGDIDIGIGRFPVTLPQEGSALLNKIIHYSSCRDSVMSDWRNVITFIADNENRNMHLHQAEELTNIVKTKYPFYNVNKIYIDSYPFVPTPAGDRCPDANKAITQAVTRGCLILNYTGHGGEGGWAAEKILTSEDVGSWKNINTLPVFVTATCEFSRFDNPERYTAGEMVLMQPNGGAIAIYSTTRLALSTSNFRLDSSFFLNLLPEDGQPIPKMGDLIRLSKNFNGNNNNIRNFVLLGDPAQSLAHPLHRIITTEVNNHPAGTDADTTLGLSTVSVKGHVEDLLGNRLTGYTGTLYPKVFDKPTIYRTLANQPEDSYQENFEMQNSLLFQGKATITNGDFGFSFVVPKSIAVKFGHGKISYYAKDSATDAIGYYDGIVVGGEEPGIDPVNPGPDISLYMETPEFLNGDRTNSNTGLLAFLSDPNGINYNGLGIGHEIVALLDDDVVHPIILDDYFSPDIDHYGSGSVTFPVSGLANGMHTLRLKAWDLYNNSAEKEIYFFVSDYPSLSVNQISNFPNPLSDATTFRFYPIEDAGDLLARIEVFTLSGLPVRTIQSQFRHNGQGVLTIDWDGRGNHGERLSDGLYIYHLTVTGENGAFFQASQKLVILSH